SIEYAGNSGNTAPDSAVEVRLGAVDGPLIGKLDVPPTGNGWGTYRTVTGKLTETITGIQSIYLVFTGTTDNNIKYIGNFDNASFSLSVEAPDSPAIIELEERSEWSSEVNSFNNNPLKTEANNGGTVVANTFDGAWLTFNEVDFGASGKNYVEIVYDAPTSRTPADVKAEIRLGDKDGALVGILELKNTGSGWGTYKTASATLNEKLKGQQTITIVFTGST